MVNDGLGELVHELKSSGKLDSSGRFTLDLQRALRKLEEFRLPGPHDYLLCLVAAASLSGARHFSLTTGPKQLEVSFDGRPFQFSELEALFPSLLDEGTDPRLRELAVGLHAARAQGPVSVQLESGRSRLELKDTRVVLQAGPASALTRIVIRRRVRYIWDYWKKNLEEEACLLRQRCCYGPLAIHLDGRLVEPPRASLLSLHRFTSEAEEPLRLGVFGAQESRRVAAFHGVCGLAPGGNDASLNFIVNGVAYPQPNQGFPPGFCAWISSPAWRRDLSLSALVQDAIWQKDLDSLHTSAKHMLVEYAESAPFLDPLAPSLLWLLQNESPVADALPLFPLDGNTERATLRELRACRERYGALFVRLKELCTSAMPGRFPDGTPILFSLDHWSTTWLRSALGDAVALVGGLERPMPVLVGKPRLLGERYLAEVSGPNWHLGLPDREPHPHYRLIRYKGQHLVANDRFAAGSSLTLLPNGLEAVVPDAEGAEEAERHLKELFHRLYASNPSGEQLRRAASYLLEVLAKANQVFTELEEPGLSPWDLVAGPATGSRLDRLNELVDLQTLIRMAYLPTKDGQHVSVHQLAKKPWPELDLTARELVILKAFLPS